MKVCIRCLIEKDETEFRQAGKGTRRPRCKKCCNELERGLYPHRTRTRASRKQEKIYAKRNKARIHRIINIIKALNGCLICGESDIDCLVFHHIDKKCFGISASGRTVGCLIVEMRKCIVVCANCHQRIHWAGLIYDMTKRCIIDEEQIMKYYKYLRWK